MVRCALILAAGNGSRLQRRGNDIPKPLREVCGLPLIHRTILSAKKAGVTRFVIVVGYMQETIRAALTQANLGVTIEFIENKDWKKSNGVSVLAAKDVLKENFFLLMSDHVFDFKILERFGKAGLGAADAKLAIDYQTSKVFDIEDATKVLANEGQIQSIGKNIEKYNAIDTGIFLVSPALFDALGSIYQQKQNCSLSEGIQVLANQGKMGTFDIEGGFWQDVDTKPALKEAQKQLLNACRKPSDGFISRHINRPISLFVSSLLMKTPLSANQITALVSVIGLFSGYCVAKGDYWNVAIGGLLFKLSSILDGCDGEISKLKFSESKLGQWLDTLSDNLTYIVFIIGVVFGVANRGNPHIVILGTLTLFGLAMTLLIMFTYLLRNTNSGSLIALQNDFKKLDSQSSVKKFFGKIQFMIKRDFFALVFFCLALFNQLEAILWAILIGTNLIWMVLLNTKMGLFRSGSVIPKHNI
ncbi:MAG: hypothetical protein A3G32_09760 [Deltaproteobacteria bacterium RIFCSPLOWO2_12_FULL_40_28]|nr:MAG: hypothetical protein A3C45_04195 [Deltaproteobacteria bacterium RIFCSPHIGHO2_02_FULL_40_28]OGQ21072.1 MAG: hypothetical protein A3E27_00100 [Deltaproteobacteria bacterium RIFCSPHIGHO2_12_FULL_40_32]OGQ38984.1 MAG: hypothetical protein A3I69_07630 [Deltaproteobacteria bacterium RIFCSPLOWO2_02_FULL_40_36]OGQ53038.1 MAG: hypothetical protein A3G32_09760 [Deltaproteobacteria bacterium RIFCSPLOWO2_12_FULL_40_28]